MAHELVPRGGGELSAREVARLLASEFAIVKTETQDALAEAKRKADWIERSPPRLFIGRHEQAMDFARRLRALGEGDALTIHFGDTPERLLKILVLPGERIRFGYGSPDEEAAPKSLVERCARVLTCDMVEI
jgi:hypothetical protein